MFLFWLAFIAMSIYRRIEITRKNNAGVEWHSVYMGTSLLPLPVSHEKIYKFTSLRSSLPPVICSGAFRGRSACG
jgi:hypothetical protein